MSSVNAISPFFHAPVVDAFTARFATEAVKVPTDLLKKLRERTGSPMVDCKNALADANLDIDKAIDLLRKKGGAHALKSASRQASKGLVAVTVTADKKAAIVIELNCETDFVERNDRFQAGVELVAAASLPVVTSAATSYAAAADCNGAVTLPLAAVQAAKLADGQSVGDQVNMLVSAIRENIVLRRAVAISVDHGLVGTYVHNAVRPGLGQIASIVALRVPSVKEPLAPASVTALQKLAEKLAMHAAGLKPPYLTRAAVPADVLAREDAVQMEQVKKMGKKPDDVIKKIVAGKMNKWYEEIVLLDQTFALADDPSEAVKISKLIDAEAVKMGFKANDVVFITCAHFFCSSSSPLFVCHLCFFR